MRISTNSLYIPYKRNLEEIQNRRFDENIKLTSGKRINNLADDPSALEGIKSLNTIIERNEKYMHNLDEVTGELMIVSDQLENISDQFTTIREQIITALNVGSRAITPTLGENVKGLLEDIVHYANMDYNGHYIFSGTKTTAKSLNKTAEADNDLPFELVEGTKTADNPSGLRVVFKGNNKDRVINKDTNTTEIINTKAEEIFGAGGEELFETVIDVYNVLAYKGDGSKRGSDTVLTDDEITKLNDLQKQITDIYDQTNIVSSNNGAKLNRVKAVRSQMQTENTTLKQILSQKEDTDVTESIINLKKSDTALQYALQAGSNMIPYTLFDFLAL